MPIDADSEWARLMALYHECPRAKGTNKKRAHIHRDVRRARIKMAAGPCSSDIGDALKDLSHDIVDDTVLSYEESLLVAKVHALH